MVIASSPSVYSIKGVFKDVEATWVTDVIEVAPVTTPASTLIVPSRTIADPVAGLMFTASAEVIVIAPEDVLMVTAAFPAVILLAANDDAVTFPPEMFPTTVRFPVTVALPLVVIAPPSAMVIARSPSVKSIVAVFNDVPTVTSPDTSRVPFKSTVVAVISTSVSASMSN